MSFLSMLAQTPQGHQAVDQGFPTFKVFAMIASAFFFLAVIELIRRHKLKEKYAILWLISSVVLLVFSSSVKLLNKVSLLFGVYYPPSFLFLVAFIFLLFIVFHYSTVLSKESERSKTLAQKMGLLEKRIEELEKETGKKSDS